VGEDRLPWARTASRGRGPPPWARDRQHWRDRTCAPVEPMSSRWIYDPVRSMSPSDLWRARQRVGWGSPGQINDPVGPMAPSDQCPRRTCDHRGQLALAPATESESSFCLQIGKKPIAHGTLCRYIECSSLPVQRRRQEAATC
jgi:hypothetical protein